MSRPGRLRALVRARSLVWATGALAACGGGGGFPDAPPADSPGPTGTFSVTWSVTDPNNQPLSCDRISAQTMTVLAHNLAFEGGQTQIFSCGTGMGTSQAMTPGTYEMKFELSGTYGLLAEGAKQAPVQLEANTNVELAPVTFQVDAHGNLALKLATNKMTNCGTAPNGAAIDQVTIALTHNSDGSCEPITLTISDSMISTQTGGTYTINCTTPMVRGCIETDQTITASAVPSDSYTIKIRGMVAGKACWLNSDTLAVPPLNKLLIRTLNLGQQTQTPGC